MATTIDESGALADGYAPMSAYPRSKSRPPKGAIGTKIHAWLDENAALRREPSSESELAKMLRAKQPTVNRWVLTGQMLRGDYLLRLASLMRVDPYWLIDPLTAWPPTKDEDDICAAIRAAVPKEEQEGWIALLRDPALRDLVGSLGQGVLAAQAKARGPARTRSRRKGSARRASRS